MARPHEFASFRARWETRHGAPGRKELALDAARVPEGPTWTSADPVPFKVLHLSGGPPVVNGDKAGKGSSSASLGGAGAMPS